MAKNDNAVSDIRSEYDFLRKHFVDGHKPIHKKEEVEEKKEGRRAHDNFVLFCKTAIDRSGKEFGKTLTKCSGWQHSGHIKDYVWYPFVRGGADDFCSVSFAMEKFYDQDSGGPDYWLIAKFEINNKGMNNPERFDRFKSIARRTDLCAEGVQYIVYSNYVHVIDDDDDDDDDDDYDDPDEDENDLDIEPFLCERILDFNAALRKFNEDSPGPDAPKRICPLVLIADGNDIKNSSVEEICDKAATAIDKMYRYYDAYYGADGETGKMKGTEKNIILYGPPGTGKTYSTVLKALGIIDGEPDKYDDVGYDTYRDVLLPRYNRYITNEEKRQIAFVTFHQSYGYEEFIEGIRPSTGEDGNISYEVKPGVFKKFCDDARKGMGEDKDGSKDVPYVFIIDEINRGNVSKIFGELITLIEDNKREGEKEAAKALLPYPKKDENGKETEDYFSVPRNVYIIGTMNTADRSITSLDTALRRRFSFKEMMPEPKRLDNIEISGIKIGEMLEKMNKRIEVLYDREHQIGHAYFMRLNNDSKVKDLARIFKNKIIPLLQEYFFDDYEKIGCVLGDNMIWDDNKPGWEGEQFIRREKINVSNLFGTKNHPPLSEPCYVYSVNEKTPDKPEAYIKIYAEQPDKKETE